MSPTVAVWIAASAFIAGFFLAFFLIGMARRSELKSAGGEHKARHADGYIPFPSSRTNHEVTVRWTHDPPKCEIRL